MRQLCFALLIVLAFSLAECQTQEELRLLYPDVLEGSEPYGEFVVTEGHLFASVFRGMDTFKPSIVDDCQDYCLNTTGCVAFNAFVIIDGQITCTLLDDRNLLSGQLVEEFRYNYYKLEFFGCSDTMAASYSEMVTEHDEDLCVTIIPGCMDEAALNFDINANADDGTCHYSFMPGCTNSLATNYNSDAVVDDGTCVFHTKAGCTDPIALNYDPTATYDDDAFRCEYPSYGCLDPDAINYNTHAMVHKESHCLYSGETSFDLFHYFHQAQISAPLLESGKDRLPKIADPHECRVLCSSRPDCKSFTHLWQTSSPWCEFYIHEQIKASFQSHRADMDYYEKLRHGCADPRAMTFDSTVEVNIGINPDDDLFTAFQGLPQWLRQAMYSSMGSNPSLRRLFAGQEGCMDPTALNYESTAVVDDGSCSHLRFDLDFGNPNTQDKGGYFSSAAGLPVSVSIASPVSMQSSGNYTYAHSDGTAELNIQNSTALGVQETNELTIILWTRILDGDGTFAHGFEDASSGAAIELGVQNQNLYIRAGTISSFTSGVTLPVNEWVQYAMAIGTSDTGDRMGNVYLNGVLVESLSGVNVAQTLELTSPFTIFASHSASGPSKFLKSDLLRFQFYNKALSLGDIQSDFSAFIAPIEVGESASAPATTTFDGFLQGTAELSYVNASNVIADQSGTFPIINSAYMQNAVMESSAVQSGNMYWLGMTKDGLAYRWYDGSAVVYSNWASAPGTDACVLLDGSTGEWTTAPCTTAAVALFDVSGSGTETRRVEYLLVEGGPHAQVTSACAAAGGTPATFRSLSELKKLKEFLHRYPDPGLKSARFWFNAVFDNSVLRSLDGDLLSFTSLEDDTAIEDCPSIGMNLKMRAANCDASYSYVCEIEAPTSPSSEYLTVPIPMRYGDAVLYCADLGLGLPYPADIGSSSAAGALEKSVQTWLAPNRLRSPAWEVNGKRMRVPLKKSSSRSMKCLRNNGDMEAVACDEVSPFVCSPIHEPVDLRCPLGSGISGNKCKKCLLKRQSDRHSCSKDLEKAPATVSDRYISTTGEVHYFATSSTTVVPAENLQRRRLLFEVGDTFDDSYCDALWPGSTAAVITTEEELEFIQSYVSEPTYLGGVYVNSSVGIQWNDVPETTVQSAVFAPNMTAGWSDGAVVMIAPDGLMTLGTAQEISVMSDANYPGLCELNNVYVAPELCEEGSGKLIIDGQVRCVPCIDPATSDRHQCVGECESSEFYDAHVYVDENNKRHCFGYYKGATRLNYGAARSACRADWYNGHLASIESLEEQQFIEAHIPLPATGVYIGLKNKDLENPWTRAKWDDGSLFEGYSNWMWGEPGYKPGFQDCTMLSLNYKWNDVQCMERANFLCEYDTHVEFDPLIPLGGALPDEWDGFGSVHDVLKWLNIPGEAVVGLTSTMYELPDGSFIDVSLFPKNVNPYSVCYYPKYGCTRVGAINFDSAANEDDGSCYYVSVPGCTDKRASNYNEEATENDGSCDLPIVSGCTDPVALNYNSIATVEDGSCTHDVYGCMNPAALNYNSIATAENYECILPGEGSTLLYVEYPGTQMSSPINGILRMKNMESGDEECKYVCTELKNGAVAYISDDVGTCVGFNYNRYTDTPFCQLFDEETLALARTIENDEFTFYAREVTGCMDETALNFDPRAIIRNDTACISLVYGCTRYTAANYNEFANMDDGSCATVLLPGCMDGEALNYDSAATLNDGSCEYPPTPGCTNPIALNLNPRANIDDGSCVLPIPGCMETGALNYNSLANIDDDSCVSVGSTSFYEYTEIADTMIYSPRRNFAQLKRVEGADWCKDWCNSRKACLAFNWREDQAGYSFCQFFNAFAMEMASYEPHEESVAGKSVVFGVVRKGCMDEAASNFDPTVQAHVADTCRYF